MLMQNKTPGCAACKSQQTLFPFSMAFQPIVDLLHGRIDAHEALVRGPANEGAGSVLRQVTPDVLYAFDQACRTKAIELAAGLGLNTRLNINFLPNAVYEPAACIRTTLLASERTGFPPDRLTFEIVETEDIADTEHLQRIIEVYRKQGFQVALDDFGSGYSGLVRLATLRPDIVKLDRDLVRDCDTDPVRLGILASLVDMGERVGVKVVFEGVERAGELAALRSIGARFVQGFLFARPVFEGLASDAEVAAGFTAAVVEGSGLETGLAAVGG